MTHFFRYHGIWAPGVRLFRRLNFRAKAALISFVFLLPLAVTAGLLFRDLSAALSQTRAELQGLAHVAETMALIDLGEQYRELQARRPGQPVGEEGAKAAAGTAAHWERLAVLHDRDGGLLGTAEAHERVAKLVQAAGSPGAAVANAEWVSTLLALQARIVDGAHLSADSRAGAKDLVDAAFVHLPVLMESAARIRLLAHAAAGTGLPGAELLREVAKLEALAEAADLGAASAIERVAAFRPELAESLQAAKPRLKAKKEMYQQAARIAAAAEGEAAAAPKPSDTPQELFALQGRMAAALGGLLDGHAASLQRKLWLVGGIIGLSLALAAYLFASFYFVMDGGLREVQRHLEAMTEGDLTTQPQPWGKDDAARLMLILSRMQASLREIVTSVRGASGAMVQASTEIADASMDLSERAEQTAANLERTASSMEEIAATGRQTADTSTQAAGVATANAKAAAWGGEVVAQVVSTMEEIQQSSSRIGDITSVIDSIAFQTNILALNAAVEAARAGEHGLGFAVVAAEVRSLAQRSATAAKEIRSLIAASVERVETGTKIVRGAGAAMEELVDNARRMDALLAGISRASQAQSGGIALVDAAVGELDRTTQQTAALVEQTAAAAAGLRERAGELASEVSRFRLPA